MKEIRLSKNEIRNRLNSLRVIPSELAERSYGVSIKYFDYDENKPSKRVDYNLSLSLKIINYEGHLSINKDEVSFNNHEPDSISELFAHHITKALYPIETNINERLLGGHFFYNFDDIIIRWNNEKLKIMDKYQSESTTLFLEKATKKFGNKVLLEQAMKNDWFWNLFFHPKLISYGDTRTIKNELYLSIIPYHAPVMFSGIQTIDKVPTDYHSFKIEFKSDVLKAPDYFSSLVKENNLLMNLEVYFDLDVYHHFPMHTRAYLKFYTQNEQTKSIHILKRIEFSQYLQNTEIFKNKKLNENSAFITGGLVKLLPNKFGFDNFENLENNW